MTRYDAIILGAGAAGLFCAMAAAKRGRSVLVLEHQKKIGSKILISGGGRCNFTNIHARPENYLSENPHFIKSALAQYTPQDFLMLIEKYQVQFYEKKLGQLFCKDSAREIIRILESECKMNGVVVELGISIRSVQKKADLFEVACEGEVFQSSALVVATGGLSLPKIGATDLGYRIAKQFGLKIVEPKAALDGFILEEKALKDLSGISLDVKITANKKSFRESILITHAGLSGPAALQASLYWNTGEEIEIDLLPDKKIEEILFQERKKKNKQQLGNFLSQFFAKRFVDYFLTETLNQKVISALASDEIESLSKQIHSWRLKPKSTVGYSKAEVTKGGVSTDELSSKSMESKKVAGLYFIGEVVDVTGWLGGYNFQWAWSSAYAAAQAL